MPTRILVVTPFDETDWVWFGPDFGGPAYAWRFENLALFGEKPWVWAGRALGAARRAREYDLVISHHPYMAFYLALAMRILRVDRPLHALSFNHGNGRFLRGGMRAAAVRLFAAIRGFVVFSEREKEIYGRHYGIPRDRFSFVHWAVRPPAVAGDLPGAPAAPYVCCMGRNNRDFELFLSVAGDLGIPAVVVCAAGRLRPEQVPGNVTVRCDIPQPEAMRLLAGAAVSVVPLKDASTGAGHMTVVSAMQLGVPQIITRLPTVGDYFVDGTHGHFVEQGSGPSLRGALERLWRAPEERARMAHAARSFADRWLSESASQRHLAAYLEAARAGAPPPPGPPGWPGAAAAAAADGPSRVVAG